MTTTTNKSATRSSNAGLSASTALLAALLCVLLGGCAGASRSEVGHRLDAKLAKEQVQNMADLRTETNQALDAKSSKLPPARQAEMAKIRDEVRKSTEDFHAKSLKLRSLLVHEVIAADSDAAEVSRIEQRMKDLTQDHLTAIFKAVHEANLEMGRWESRNERVTNQVLDDMTTDMFETR